MASGNKRLDLAHASVDETDGWARRGRCGLRLVGLLGISVVVGALMWLLNHFSGYSGDDYLYHFFYQGELPKPHLRQIHNAWDLIQSLQNHTRLFNGRFVAHAGVMIAMQLPKAVYNIANAVVFVLVGWLIDLHVFGKTPIRVSFLGLTYALMWFALPDYGTTILWLSGGFNYLWMALVYLTFLLPYRFNFKARYPKLMAVGMGLLGFLAGATNENTAALTLFIAFGLTLFDWRDSQLAWKWVGGLFGALGFYVMVRAGTSQIAVRGKQFELGKLLQQAARYSGLWLVLVFGLLIYLYWQHHTYGHQLLWHQQRSFTAAGLYAIGAGLGIAALIVSPQIVSRVFFGPNLYLIIALLLALQDHALLRHGSWLARLLVPLVAVSLSFMAIPSFDAAVVSNYHSYCVWLTGDRLCRQAAAKGLKRVGVPGMPPVYTARNQYWSSTYVNNQHPEHAWFNMWMARYYGVQTVAVDNTIPVPQAAKPTHTLAWQVYRGLVAAHAAVMRLFAAHAVHAASAMCSATLIYVDEHGQVVGSEPIAGPAGSTFDISHASRSGYQTNAGNPQQYTFTAAADQTITIHVTKQAAPAHALLAYTLASGRVVGSEPISGRVGQVIALTHASLAGYRTQAQAPKAYRLTQAAKQVVTIPVAPQLQGVTISYYNGSHRVLRVFQQVKTGATIKLRAPLGYRIAKGVAHSRVMPAQGLAKLSVAVVRQTGWRRLRWSMPFWLIMVAVVFCLWDQLAAWRVYKGV